MSSKSVDSAPQKQAHGERIGVRQLHMDSCASLTCSHGLLLQLSWSQAQRIGQINQRLPPQFIPHPNLVQMLCLPLRLSSLD